MKKQIRLLVENLFDDLYDIEDQKNLDTDLADQYLNYKIGDFWYYNKDPYAICCGEPDDFQDKEPRFVFNEKLYYEEYTADPNYYDKKFIVYHNEYFSQNIDETGYENTKNLFNMFVKKNLDLYPHLKYCKSIGDFAYIPAEKELITLLTNRDKLKNTELDFDIDWFLYTSTLFLSYKIYVIYIYNNTVSYAVTEGNPFNRGYICPFINIKNIK